MNILHLCTHLNTGGISHVLLSVCSRFAATGHKISVLSSGGQLRDSFEKKAVRCFDFSIRTKNEFHPKVLLALPAAIRLVKNNRIDVLHAHTRVTQVFAFLVSKMTGVPFVSTAHGFYKPRFSRRIFPCWGERVIAISPLVAESLEKDHGVGRKKIRMIQNAFDTGEFLKKLYEKNKKDLKRKYGIPGDSVVIGAVGRLVRDKGHEFLIEAVASLAKENQNIFLLILGDGRERDQLSDKINQAGLAKKAKIVPSEKDATNILSVMDIFVHPATYREGFGLSIAEAMVAKKPVIATDIPAINTLIRNEQNGLVVKPSDAEALKGAIRFLIDNSEISKKLAEEGYETAVRICSMDRMASEMESVYREVVK